MYQMRMRPAVPAALDERQVGVRIVVNALGGEALDRLGKQPRVIRHGHALRLLACVNHRRLVFDLRPFECRLVPVYIEALAVLPGGLEQ